MDDDTITTYFELATDADTERYFGQFTDGAIVEDEGHEHHGIAAIRAWRTAVPDVRYAVQHVDRRGDRADARVDISGDFPGSPVTLTFLFELTADERIAVLRIRA